MTRALSRRQTTIRKTSVYLCEVAKQIKDAGRPLALTVQRPTPAMDPAGAARQEAVVAKAAAEAEAVAAAEAQAAPAAEAELVAVAAAEH
jgi:hypothetical protein